MKPIENKRLDTHTEEDIRAWFKEYYNMLKEYKIIKGKNVLNIDESSARVRCPAGEHVIMPADIEELYTSSPENRKTVTVIETIITDGRKPLPPFIIAPGKKIIEN